MKKTEIGIALTAVESYLAQHIAFSLVRRKAAVVILEIGGGDDNIAGNFNKIPVIAAVGADYPAQRPTGGNLHLFHYRLLGLVVVLHKGNFSSVW